jgi:hypothetical protein
VQTRMTGLTGKGVERAARPRILGRPDVSEKSQVGMIGALAPSFIP